MPPKRTLLGDSYGRWTVIGGPEVRARTKRGKAIWSWFCRCECGTERWVDSTNLCYRTSLSKSCGCLHRERASAASYKHGGTVNGPNGRRMGRLMRTWANMITRCENPARPFYYRYGGRGITVCPEWHDFAVFQAWAWANGYAQDLTIDRIDNDSGYEPANCRWTTQQVQMNNTCRSRRIEAFGEIKTVAEWSRDPRCSIRAQALYDRLVKLAWEPERAISTPRQRTGVGS